MPEGKEGYQPSQKELSDAQSHLKGEEWRESFFREKFEAEHLGEQQVVLEKSIQLLNKLGFSASSQEEAEMNMREAQIKYNSIDVSTDSDIVQKDEVLAKLSGWQALVAAFRGDINAAELTAWAAGHCEEAKSAAKSHAAHDKQFFGNASARKRGEADARAELGIE